MHERDDGFPVRQPLLLGERLQTWSPIRAWFDARADGTTTISHRRLELRA
ncbi:hypothetical protein [Mycolicibacterium gadium]|nr:hypothetical protein [Mycolicibacterium gadium]